MGILGRKPRKNLKRVLLDQSYQFQETGGCPANAINAISAYKKIVLKRLIIQAIAFPILLAVGTYVSISVFSDQKALAAIVAAFFGSGAGLVANIFGTWRELDYSNLILMLIRDANDEQIKAIIDQLIDKL